VIELGESKTKHVLYMEDDPGLARLVEKRLRRAGYEVDLAANGEEGLAAFSSRPYDVLLLDHEMPIYSGLQVIEILASEQRLPPTVMLTGSGNEQTAVEAMKHGAGDYIVKDPAGGYLELLPTVIERVLASHRLIREKLQAEEALRESEARFRTVAETAADAIICSDIQGRIILWNRAAERIFGYNEQQALGMNREVLVPKEMRTEHEANRDAMLAAHEQREAETTMQHFETVGQRADGTILPLEVSIAPWETSSGTYFTTTVRDISERKEYEKKLQRMARYDSLTGTFNRHHLATVLRRETERAERYDHPIGFLMIDVDRLKMINDTRGHAMGDLIIQSVASVIQGAVRRVDLVFRYGGDEFLVVLPETNGTTRFAKDHIVQAMERWNRSSDLLPFDVTLSIGVSHWLPSQGITTDEALDEADRNMYVEKHAR